MTQPPVTPPSNRSLVLSVENVRNEKIEPKNVIDSKNLHRATLDDTNIEIGIESIPLKAIECTDETMGRTDFKHRNPAIQVNLNLDLKVFKNKKIGCAG